MRTKLGQYIRVRVRTKRVLNFVFDKKSNEPIFKTTQAHPRSPGVTKGQ